MTLRASLQKTVLDANSYITPQSSLRQMACRPKVSFDIPLLLLMDRFNPKALIGMLERLFNELLGMMQFQPLI